MSNIWSIGVLTIVEYGRSCMKKIRTTYDFWILCRNCLVVRSGGYVLRRNQLSTILKSILKNYNYGVDLALLRQWITLCPVKGTYNLISLYSLIGNIWRRWQVLIPWRLVRCDCHKSSWVQGKKNYDKGDQIMS